LRKKTSKSGFSCCGRTSRTCPVSLNTRSLVVDGAKRDNCEKIDECFFQHYVVTDIDFEHLLITSCSSFLLIFSVFLI